MSNIILIICFLGFSSLGLLAENDDVVCVKENVGFRALIILKKIYII